MVSMAIGRRMGGILALAAVLSVANAFAGDCKWTGGGANGNWHTAANWENGTVPNNLTDDRAIFDNGGTLAVNLDTAGAATKDTSLRAIIVKNGTKLTLTASAGARFQLGGTLVSFGQGLVVSDKDSRLVLGAPVYAPSRSDIWTKGELVIRSVITNAPRANDVLFFGGNGLIRFEGDSGFVGGDILFGEGDYTDADTLRLEVADNAKMQFSAFRVLYENKCANQVIDIDGEGVEFSTDSWFGDTRVATADWVERTYEVNLRRGSMTVGGYLYLARNRIGRFNQTGGTLQATFLHLGAEGTKFARGALVQSGGTFKWGRSPTGENGGVLSGDIRSCKWIIEGGTNVNVRPQELTYNAKLEIAGDVTLEAVAGAVVKMQNIFVHPGSKITVKGPGMFGSFSTFYAPREMTVQDGGTFQLQSGVMVLPNVDEPEPWKLTLKDGGKFGINSADAGFMAPADVYVDEGQGSALYGTGRCMFFLNSLYLNGVRQPRGTFLTQTASGPLRSTSGSGLAVMYRWTGAGDGVSFGDAANWSKYDDETAPVVPPSDKTTVVDLTASGEKVVLDKGRLMKCVFSAKEPSKGPTVVDGGEGDYALTLGTSGLLPAAQILRENALRFDGRVLRWTQSASYEGGNFIFTKQFYHASSEDYTPVGGEMHFRGDFTFFFSGTASKDLLFTGSGADTMRGSVWFDEGLRTTVDNIYFNNGGYSWLWKYVQRANTSVTVSNEIYMTKCSASAASPDGYVLEGGELNVGKALRLGALYATSKAWNRYPGGNFLMTGGVLNVPLMTSEQNQNWFWLKGGTVNLGAGGFGLTDDSTKRAKYTKNATPTLQLGGVTLRPSDSAGFTVGVPTEFTGDGGATVIDTDDKDVVFAAGQTVSGSGALVKRGSGTLAFAGTTAAWTGALVVEAGTVSFAGTAAPSSISVVSGASVDVAAGVTLAVGEYFVNGVRQPAGDYSLGGGKITVAATGNFWTNAKGNGFWSDAGNWSAGIVPNGDTATVDFSLMPMGADVTITLNEKVVLRELVYGRAGGGRLTIKSNTPEVWLSMAPTSAVSTASMVKVMGGSELVFDTEFMLGHEGKTKDEETCVLNFTGGGTIRFSGRVSNSLRSGNFNSGWATYTDGGTAVIVDKKWDGVWAKIFTANRQTPQTSLAVEDGSDMAICNALPFCFNDRTTVGGLLTVNGGKVTMLNNMTLVASTTAEGTFLLNGGEVYFQTGCTKVKYDSGKTYGHLLHWNLNGGTISMGGGVGSVLNRDLTDVTLVGGVTLKPDAGAISTVGCDIKGHGLVVKDGAGEIRWEGSMACVDILEVNEGTLTLAPRAAYTLDGTVPMTMARGTVLNLDFDGIAEVRSLTVGDRPCAAGIYSAAEPPLGMTVTGGGHLLVRKGDVHGVVLIVR